MPTISIDGQKLANTLLAALLLFVASAAWNAHNASILMQAQLAGLTEKVAELKVEVVKLRDAAHTHPAGPGVPAYRPAPED